MSFANLFVQSQKSLPPTNGFASLFQTLPADELAKQQRIQQLQNETQIAKANADYASSYKGFLGEVGNTFKGIGGAVVDTVKNTFQQGFQAGGQLKTAVQTGTPSQKIAAGLNVAVAGVGVPFLPVTVAFTAAEKIPILKPAADLIGFAVGTIPGILGKFAGDRFTDALPISQQAKDNLRPAIESVGSLVAQIYLGAKIIDTLASGKVLDKTKIDTLVEETKKVPIKDLTPNEQPIPINSRKIPIKNLSPKETGINVQTPYIPDNQLPTIQVGGTYKPSLPTIQIEKPFSNELPSGLRYVSVNEPKPFSTLFTEAPQKTTPPLTQVIRDTTKPLETPTTGGTIPSEFSKSMEGRAIEAKLTESFGQLPGHERINMLDQAGLAYDMIKSDPERALRIAKGEETPPSNILPGTMAVSLGEYARLNNDVATMREIATSPDIAGIAQAIGQGLKSFDTGARESIDPIKIMRDVGKARESAKAIPKAKAEVFNEIKAEIKKSISGRPTWEEFIKEVQCGY